MAKILIVDDEEVARLTLAEILRFEGYEIQSVGSGQEAVTQLNCEAYDLMILDLKMPGMNGIDVLHAVAENNPDLGVIVMTAYGSINSAIQSIRYRVLDYLLKPVTPEQVLESIKNALIKKSAAAHEIREEPKYLHGRTDQLPGGAVLAWDKRQITWSDGCLSLTPTEARLLRILFDRKNEMVQHTELVFMIQGYRIDSEEAAKILRPVVSRLRQKLANVPEWGDRIKNVRGAGYVLEID